MTKSELRQKYKRLRAEMTETEIDNESLKIANKCLELDIWNFEYYHLFLSIKRQKEINTEYILQIIYGKDGNVVVPKMDISERSLSHFLLTDSTSLKLNDWNIPEPQNGIQVFPSQIDVVFIPLMAFDKIGNRIGYGKGFYDGFLKDCKADVIKIGLSFFSSEDNIIPTELHDIPLDFCVTPDKIYKFNSKV
ncbi:5-formyltetrahydrofolate cyclo-ligase [Psychroflexus aestuariivivens]|uniref:5-formyltetrahydrofolate cyclo-ligase n=1 Tax=Psychroflexus aestuariivivens TaxID=1795040 RepID=UPI000FD8968F|nr:5-formyltetrahydrofolate cyclo-ligase [Psychroflexus aestuariivivens]